MKASQCYFSHQGKSLPTVTCDLFQSGHRGAVSSATPFISDRGTTVEIATVASSVFCGLTGLSIADYAP